MTTKENNNRLSFLFKDDGLNNGNFGWVNELTNKWEIEPKYSYESMLHFDFDIYFKEMEKLKQVAIKRALRSKKSKKNILSSYRENISFIQTFFGVILIKNACLNYDEQLCFRSTNLNCIKCSSRLNDYEERLCDE